MNLPYVVAAAMFVGIIAYALFAGADFGAGYYDLTAGSARDGAVVRTRIDHSIGPVWEANHVWLIYVLVVWWTGFPRSFAAVTTTLQVPLYLALLGIVLRGASFAFRKYAATLGQARLFGAVFAASSVITPFFLGATVGAVVSGRVPGAGAGAPVASWVTPTSVAAGLVAVGTCVFLGGTFLTADAHRSADEALTERLRRRVLRVGAATGVLVIGALPVLRVDAPVLADGLIGRALPLVLASVAAGMGALTLIWCRRFGAARVAAGLAVVFVLAGWALAQYPWMLVGQLTVTQAAGAPATLIGLIVVAVLAAVLVLPPLAYLLRMTQLENGHPDAG